MVVLRWLSLYYSTLYLHRFVVYCEYLSTIATNLVHFQVLL